ncbi:DUF5706 domain-containing protein [Galbibacter sp. EGI 63066]|uniref:Pycsar system effector family protein n=1 Tax=Galbibacter sp. EGI 63066 TaxID=2993559 RepID=UPI002249809D|nr:Pycsar system effector family protein [Galbibacter sp. EGI 63066]MCX2679734.1 DUF5706 domain-containing protein [Galbibacter sp. EGI 63066]
MNTLVEEAEKYVVQYLNENLDKSFVYHNLSHIIHVVEKAQELIEAMQIGDEQAQELLLAAWFHDMGYSKVKTDHEKESAKLAVNFLKEKNVPDTTIEVVRKLILSTKMGYEPQNELEQIICDADCAHVGSENYSEFTELLRKEIELTQNKEIDDSEWLSENINFLANQHRFYTRYALTHWGKVKSRNLAQLIKKENKLLQQKDKLERKKEEFAFKKKKVKLPERGIETMFRVALRNHITLSNIADTKANILLSVNAIIVSLVLANLIPKLDNPSNSYLIYPTVVFVIFTVVSIVLSIAATRPNVTQGEFTKQDVANKKVNLIFFGNFHKMKLNDFEWAMNEMMKDRDYLYGSLTKDLYFLGLVLHRKYKILRITYTIFMTGIIISVIAFAIAFHFYA